MENLSLFLSSLQMELRNAIGKKSRVLWYDALIVNGDLKWQNELNEENWSVPFHNFIPIIPFAGHFIAEGLCLVLTV